MISISDKKNGFCSLCCKETDDSRTVTLSWKGKNENKMSFCERCLKQLGETICFLFEDGDGEQE